MLEHHVLYMATARVEGEDMKNSILIPSAERGERGQNREDRDEGLVKDPSTAAVGKPRLRNKLSLSWHHVWHVGRRTCSYAVLLYMLRILHQRSSQYV